MSDNIIELTVDIDNTEPEDMSIEIADPVAISIPVSCAGSNTYIMKPNAIGTPLESPPILIVPNNSMRFTISGSASKIVLGPDRRDRIIETSENSSQVGYTIIGIQNIKLQNVSTTSGIIYGIGSTMRTIRIALDGSSSSTINATGSASGSTSKYWTVSYTLVYMRNDLVIKER